MIQLHLSLKLSVLLRDRDGNTNTKKISPSTITEISRDPCGLVFVLDLMN